MQDGTLLAAMLRSTEPLMMRYLEGFTDATRCSQAHGMKNHLAWIIGHCALTMHRVAERVEGFDTPQRLLTSDWVHGDGTAGDPSRFDTESVRYGSEPSTDPKRYPRMDRCVEILQVAFGHLAVTLEAAKPEALDRKTRWGGGEVRVRDLVPRMIFHNGTHTGQIIDLRRALGMPKTVG